VGLGIKQSTAIYPKLSKVTTPILIWLGQLSECKIDLDDFERNEKHVHLTKGVSKEFWYEKYQNNAAIINLAFYPAQRFE